MTATERRKTVYLVLERVTAEDVERYDVIGRSEQNGPVQAVKAVTAELDLPDATLQEFFVAVPLTNWTAVAKSVKVPEPVVTYAVLPEIGTVPPQEAEAEAQQGLHAVEDLDGAMQTGEAIDGERTEIEGDTLDADAEAVTG